MCLGLRVSSYLQRAIYLPRLKETNSGNAHVLLVMRTKHIIIISRLCDLQAISLSLWLISIIPCYVIARKVSRSFSRIMRSNVFRCNYFPRFVFLQWDFWLSLSCGSNRILMISNWIWRSVFCCPERKKEAWNRPASSGESEGLNRVGYRTLDARPEITFHKWARHKIRDVASTSGTDLIEQWTKYSRVAERRSALTLQR